DSVAYVDSTGWDVVAIAAASAFCLTFLPRFMPISRPPVSKLNRVRRLFASSALGLAIGSAQILRSLPIFLSIMLLWAMARSRWFNSRPLAVVWCVVGIVGLVVPSPQRPLLASVVMAVLMTAIALSAIALPHLRSLLARH